MVENLRFSLFFWFFIPWNNSFSLRQHDLVEWSGDLLNLETLIIYKAPELTREAVENVLEHYPNLQKFGDFRSFDFRRPQDMKKLQQKIKDESWNLTCIESVSSNSEEKDFAKLLSLHWFYLTESKSSKEEWRYNETFHTKPFSSKHIIIYFENWE